jgi:magnesium transporter
MPNPSSGRSRHAVRTGPTSHKRAAGVVRDSAAHRLVRRVPTALPDASCAEVLASLHGRQFDYAGCVVIIDSDRRVVGLLPTGTLATLEPQTPVSQAMLRNLPLATLDMDQERVATLAIHSGIATTAVVDDAGRFAGVVPPQTLLTVLRDEHVEDLHRLTGVIHETEVAREAIEAPPTRRVRHRLPWLLVGLAGSVMAALVMAQFEAVLQSRVAIAFFVPGIVYLADAIGTQTEAIAVRGLSISHLPIGQLLVGELWTGVLLGVILGALAFAGVWGVMQDFGLALSIGVALTAAGASATLIGLLLPWAFQRFGYDPAYGSGPLGTVTQDVLSLLVYFTSLSLVLRLPEP